MTRVDLFQVVKIKKLKDFGTIMQTVGVNPESQGCEICKPAIASILSSLYNEHIMKPQHHGLQDTNDRSEFQFSLVYRVRCLEYDLDKSDQPLKSWTI